MLDQQCIQFLQWCLPKLGYRWRGFRKVRKQVCKRVVRRMVELELKDSIAYKAYLESHSEEWEVLDSFCYITISRFYRDKKVFETLHSKILPELAQKAIENNRKEVFVWSAGCCAGEEAHTLQIIWQLSVLPNLDQSISLKIIATDKEEMMLERARKGIYPHGSVKDLPKDLKGKAFEILEDGYHLKEQFKRDVSFVRQNILREMPEGSFDLILCRNLVFTYFDEDRQRLLLGMFLNVMQFWGVLVVSASEDLPIGSEYLMEMLERGIYKKGRRIM